jgi:hypothetical protein
MALFLQWRAFHCVYAFSPFCFFVLTHSSSSAFVKVATYERQNAAHGTGKGPRSTRFCYLSALFWATLYFFGPDKFNSLNESNSHCRQINKHRVAKTNATTATKNVRIGSGAGAQQSLASARSKQEARFFIQSALNAMCMEVRLVIDWPFYFIFARAWYSAIMCSASFGLRPSVSFSWLTFRFFSHTEWMGKNGFAATSTQDIYCCSVLVASSWCFWTRIYVRNMSSKWWQSNCA